MVEPNLVHRSQQLQLVHPSGFASRLAAQRLGSACQASSPAAVVDNAVAVLHKLHVPLSSIRAG